MYKFKFKIGDIVSIYKNSVDFEIIGIENKNFSYYYIVKYINNTKYNSNMWLVSYVDNLDILRKTKKQNHPLTNIFK